MDLFCSSNFEIQAIVSPVSSPKNYDEVSQEAFELLCKNIESTKKYVNQVEKFLEGKKLVMRNIHKSDENLEIDISKYEHLYELGEKIEQYSRDFKKIYKLGDLLIKKPSDIPLNEILKIRSEKLIRKTNLFLNIVNQNARFEKFTYQRLVHGLKNQKFKNIIIVTGQETSHI